MKNYTFFAALFVVFFAGHSALARNVDLAVGFDYKGLNQHMQLYTLKDGVLDTVAKTRVVKSLAKAPVGKLIQGSLKMKAGEGQTFVLVMNNKSDKDIFFFAAPHIPSPPEASIGFFFECLCNSHVYKVTPHSIWYRVVRLEINEDFSPAKAEIRHTIVGVKAADVGTKYTKVIFNEE